RWQQRGPRRPAHRTGPGARSMSTPYRFRAWWQGRAPRERAMLALMAAMLAAFAWWYGLLWPLRVLRDDAGAHYDRAALALQAAGAPRGGVARQRDLLERARAAGLVPSRQRTAADGTFVLEFERIPAPALFGWLGGLADRDALAPASLRVERADGHLRAEVGF